MQSRILVLLLCVEARLAALLVEAHDIQVHLGQKQVLSDVHLHIKPREIVTLVGPNGAGKSTLLKVVLGLIQPRAGLLRLKPGLRMGYMPQNTSVSLFIPLPVYRFLALAGSFDQAWVKQVALELGIIPLLNTPLQALSGGEFQRVLLARALLPKPDLLVLDEPVQGVDLSGQAELYGLIATLRKRYHCAILMVSHDLHLVMAETDSVICLNQHVCCEGSPAVISQNPVFLKLFGIQDAQTFAIYTHHHDHAHFGREKCP
ncbi:MAG: ATP-binding cassette domain-containing protein [Gammaproteobacteria bacterium]|nr:ATP-binding cassette domain-containing protein [Gammaproteobacteria bacterium]MBP9729097.1 ATP-binding cassette domain-containing protein [Gammaproteobacteria bacterium]